MIISLIADELFVDHDLDYDLDYDIDFSDILNGYPK